MLLVMYHIAIYIPCITLFNFGQLLHIRVDHVEPMTEDQVEQVQLMFGDLQALSCDDTNIA
jgi:hypothetical protein